MFYDRNANTFAVERTRWVTRARTSLYIVRTKDSAVYRRTSRHLNKRIHDAGDVPRTAAAEAPRVEFKSEPQLLVTRRPRIPTVSPPNQPAEVPVAYVPAVQSYVRNIPLRSRYASPRGQCSK